ncbi:flagellar associated protein [Raphidocelis subcapitata]|uniref:Cilia- and flagella-associated protein 126 n=1 Tax=Raphidocelis subcapitata TaxID=307507 RepID=A0A2V0NPF5_9CHLO|nr:flagellar associated protein [Raphidocelis subcapitata]|eukprot:GBF89501.1 flagellar associated protein [Raphidocelis subcapitata]
MSRIYSAGQYEQDFLPKRLCNWGQPDTGKERATSAGGRFGTLRARPAGARTQFVVDARGHLLPGVRKTGGAFFPAGAEGAPPRWPSAGLLTLPAAPAATLGYKGIATDYLPSSTVTIRTVELPGCRERRFM